MDSAMAALVNAISEFAKWVRNLIAVFIPQPVTYSLPDGSTRTGKGPSRASRALERARVPGLVACLLIALLASAWMWDLSTRGACYEWVTHYERGADGVGEVWDECVDRAPRRSTEPSWPAVVIAPAVVVAWGTFLIYGSDIRRMWMRLRR